MIRNRGFHVAVALVALVSACTEETTSGPTPSVQIVEAGWSFGFCIGPCRGELDINGSQLAYRVTDRTGAQVFATNRGRLTAPGAARLDLLARALPQNLQDRYGCPDCADGGASSLRIARGSTSETTEYEYRNPPPELAAVDVFLRDIMEAMGECRETPDLTPEPDCTPLRS